MHNSVELVSSRVRHNQLTVTGVSSTRSSNNPCITGISEVRFKLHASLSTVYDCGRVVC